MSYPRYNTSAQPPRFDTITQKRLDQFQGGYYSGTNLSSALELARVDITEHGDLGYWDPNPPGKLREGFGALWEEAKEAFDAGKGCAARKGDKFGPTFEWDSTGEALVYDHSGNALQGLTGGTRKEDRRVEFVLPPQWVQGGEIILYIEASINGMTGNCGIDPPTDDLKYPLVSADLVIPNQPGRALAYDFEALRQLATNLPSHSPLGNRARNNAADIINLFETHDPAPISECRRLAESILGEHWEEALATARKRQRKDGSGDLWALGHCHIDTAWLWPWEVTKRKVARSWSTQLDLIDRYPEYRFIATSAQQYAWLEQYYPDVFSRLQAKVKEGTFRESIFKQFVLIIDTGLEIEGATWLEHDANMLSGESFARQFLLGQNFFKTRFGKRCKTFVLPDTFGYSAALPQIARLSGCDNFFTQKISWNAYNTFPLTTFNWIGLDGTQILTHMTPTVNYNSACDFEDILKAHTGHHNLATSPSALLLFGNGDGGGGPTPDHLEKLRRWRAVSEKNDSEGAQSAVIRMGGSMEDFFEQIKAETRGGRELPSWWGELYLEIHRGTYTSQARTKKGNRDGEITMRYVELICTLASLDREAHFAYPHDEIRLCWEALCLCQFHDTLPGSVIHRVADDLADKYSEFRSLSSRVVTKAEAALLKSNKGAEKRNVVFSPTAFTNRLAVLQVPKEYRWAQAPGSLWQDASNGSHGFTLVASAGGVLCARSITSALKEDVKVTRIENGFQLSNATLDVKITQGRLTSLYDIKAERELVADHQSAGFVIYQDKPLDWDAWDVDEYHLETPDHLTFTTVEITENGPLRAVLECTLEFGNSKGTVWITLDAVSSASEEASRSLLRFDVEFDWRERHRFLKFEIPTTIHAQEATYDTAFGVTKRAVHRNTLFERARFEVPAHKFADLSEYNYGLALLNNSKYGYAVQGNVMRVSLLRSPMRPDDTCDQGAQAFAFALLPHLGSYENSVVAEVAESFNNPIRVLAIDEAFTLSSMLTDFPIQQSGSRGVSIETIKRGEGDINGATSIVLRTFEHFGGQASVKISFPRLNVKSVYLVNILEDVLEGVEVAEGSIALKYRPFEIKSIKLVL